MASSAQFKEDELYTCALCNTLARYKCPRCTTPTCSLPCSRRHKQDTGCTGERNKAQYVPMNAYGWGTMMRDYCYLEEVGRNVSKWGNEIVRGGYTVENHSRERNVRGRGGGRASNGRRKVATGKSKRDILRAHLEMLDIDVELLANGMERRKLNQSTFDQKSKCPYLTIEFKFHPPATSASTSSPPASGHTVLSHRNQLSTTLIAALQRHAPWTPQKSQKQKEIAPPHWLPALVNPHPDDPEGFVPPHCYMRARVDFLPSIHRGHAAPVSLNTAYYHKLDPTLNLAELLRHAHFVEFPTIHVFDPDASSFTGTVIDKAGSIARFSEDEQGGERASKRRKLNKKVGMQAIAGLVGEYGSESSSQSEAELENKQRSGLATLGEYSGSDGDEETLRDVDHCTQDGCHAMSDDESSSDAEDTPVDPAVLLELVKQARGAVDEDVVDWGDEWDPDGEE